MAIIKEVHKLLKVGFIYASQYPEWVAKFVMIKKANGLWRMRVDFTNLNKVCPKGSYPLPRIN